MARIPIASTLAAVFTIATLTAAQAPKKPAPAPHPTPKPDDAQLYRNSTFGFRYQIPYGWVDRTKEMDAPESSDQPNAAESPQGDVPKSQTPKAQAHGEVLLAVFERPPQAPGSTVNSAVVIAAERASAYPGLKKAEDYLGPLSELTAAKGFKPEADPGIIQIDSRQLLRADFSRPLGPVANSADTPAKDSAKEPSRGTTENPSKDDTPLTMHQSTLILLIRGQILSFTFIAGTADEIDDLIAALHFNPSRANAP